MAEIEAHIVAGRYAIACRDLDRLLAWKSDPTGGIVYLLGSCELARGRTRAAGAAWERVVPGSEFSERAIRGRMRLFQQSGRYADAEQLIDRAADDPRHDRTALLALLVPMLGELGRHDEAARLIEERWEALNQSGEAALEPAIKLLRLHIDLSSRPAPVEDARRVLDRASQLAPDDDRVWLGRANLAIRTGALDDAGRLLDACLQRRPDDVPVWQARLNWGLATRRVDVVQQALTHLPAAQATPSQIHRLRAWLAADRGDTLAERQELERQLAIVPADRSTLDRLARLAEAGKDPDQAAEYRRRNADIDRLRTRYDQLHARNQPLRDAAEMARLAQQLGREFEARAFLAISIADEPDREDLRRDLRRPARAPAAGSRTGQTLAELIDAGRADRG
jgi:thioredoxin-like negative regulator of GroEL